MRRNPVRLRSKSSWAVGPILGVELKRVDRARIKKCQLQNKATTEHPPAGRFRATKAAPAPPSAVHQSPDEYLRGVIEVPGGA